MNNNAILKDVWSIMRRFSVSWMGILVMVVLLLMALGGYTVARAALVALFGALGAYAAFRLHFGDRRVNPYFKLKRSWKLPRTFSIVLVSVLALGLSTALFFEGIFTTLAADRVIGLYFAAANGFFFFGAVYGISGLICVSEARQRLLQASFDDKQRWREEMGRLNAGGSDMRRVVDALYRLSMVPASQFIGTRKESDGSA